MLFAEAPNTNAIYKHKVTVTALCLRGLFELARERVILNTFCSNKQSAITHYGRHTTIDFQFISTYRLDYYMIPVSICLFREWLS